MFKFCLLPPPFLYFFFFTLLTLFLCPAAPQATSLQSIPRFTFRAHLHFNRLMDLCLCRFCVCVCAHQSKWWYCIHYSIHVFFQPLWLMALSAPWSVKVRGSKLTASQPRARRKDLQYGALSFHLRTQWSRPSTFYQSSSPDVHHHDYFFFPSPHCVSFLCLRLILSSTIHEISVTCSFPSFEAPQLTQNWIPKEGFILSFPILHLFPILSPLWFELRKRQK